MRSSSGGGLRRSHPLPIGGASSSAPAELLPVEADCTMSGGIGGALTRFQTASTVGDPRQVRKLGGDTLALALHAAVAERDIRAVKALLAAGADPNRVAQGRVPVLVEVLQAAHLAAGRPKSLAVHEAIADTLWGAGARADLASCDSLRVTALLSVAAQGQLHWLRRFLDAGLSPFMVTKKGGFSLLWLAKAHGRAETAAFLEVAMSGWDRADLLGHASSHFDDPELRVQRLRDTKAHVLELYPELKDTLGITAAEGKPRMPGVGSV